MSELSCDLRVSCVIYQGDQQELFQTLDSLVESCEQAKSNCLLNKWVLALIDNGPDAYNQKIIECIKRRYEPLVDTLLIYAGHGNVGYGAGHNLALLTTTTAYHLVLNPDVILASDNISVAIQYMNDNPDVGLLAPDAFYSDGARQYIAKRQPKWHVLAARAINAPWLNHVLKTSMDKYEYRDLIPASQPFEIELASGCYMLMRSESAKKIGGFDPKFFMYFEDFNLSQRMHLLGRVIHHPQVKIVHYGGGAPTKGWRHIFYFCASFYQFFSRHHFKL